MWRWSSGRSRRSSRNGPDLPIRPVDNDGWDSWLARGGVVSPAENSPQRVIDAVIAEMNV